MTSGPVHINTSIMGPLTILLNSLSLDYFKNILYEINGMETEMGQYYMFDRKIP